MLEILVIWMYYSKIYILGSIIMTFILNRFFSEKLYIAPLIINMVSVIMIFLLPYKDRSYAMYVNYMPVVLSSILLNLSIYFIRKIEKTSKKS